MSTAHAITAEADAASATNPGPDAEIEVAGARVVLRPTGAFYWPERGLLAVADLHLGRAERLAREGGELLPPYETIDTLDRLEAEIVALQPRGVVCLGDSFDDLAAARNLSAEVLVRIGRLAAGRHWCWIAGNHDPGPVELPGSNLAELRLGLLNFRHIALARLGASGGEVSGHYHPKARLNRRGTSVTRRCFLADGRRVILPAFGTYTGGLDVQDPAFDTLLGADAGAWMLGKRVTGIPRARLDG